MEGHAANNTSVPSYQAAGHSFTDNTQIADSNPAASVDSNVGGKMATNLLSVPKIASQRCMVGLLVLDNNCQQPWGARIEYKNAVINSLETRCTHKLSSAAGRPHCLRCTHTYDVPSNNIYQNVQKSQLFRTKLAKRPSVRTEGIGTKRLTS